MLLLIVLETTIGQKKTPKKPTHKTRNKEKYSIIIPIRSHVFYFMNSRLETILLWENKHSRYLQVRLLRTFFFIRFSGTKQSPASHITTEQNGKQLY